ncbi:hypothetical protein CUMW_145370, partial [Citrus unshiu]
SALRCNFSSSFPHTRKPTSSISENEPSDPTTTAKLKESLRLTVKDGASLEKFLKERSCFTPDAVTFTSLIKGLCADSRIMEAAALFTKLRVFGCEPDVFTYNTLINGLCRTGHTIVALNLFEEMANGNGEFGVEGFVDKAMELFLQMKDENINPNVVTYNSLIHWFSHADDWNEAKRLFIKMMDQGVHPNVVTFSVIVDELCKNGKMEEASRLLDLMIQIGVHPNTFVYNTLMDGFCLTGRVNRAKELFVSMESNGCMHDVVSYTTLINGYCKTKDVEEALNLYRKMLSKGIRPTVVTYSTLFLGLFEVHQVEHALKLFDEMQHNDVAADTYIYNTFIDGLCKNGFVLEALELFRAIRNSNTACLRSFIGSSQKSNARCIYSFNRCGLVKNEISLNSLPSFPVQEQQGEVDESNVKLLEHPKTLICSISIMLQKDMSPGDTMFSTALLMDPDCSCDLESLIHNTDLDQDELAYVITNST